MQTVIWRVALDERIGECIDNEVTPVFSNITLVYKLFSYNNIPIKQELWRHSI